MEIRCKKCDCVFNTGTSCNAAHITVNDEGDCSTYCCDKLKQNLIIENGNLFEVSAELAPRNMRNVPLMCHATNCLFNRAKACYANGITVIDSDDDAGCATFIER